MPPRSLALILLCTLACKGDDDDNTGTLATLMFPSSTPADTGEPGTDDGPALTTGSADASTGDASHGDTGDATTADSSTSAGPSTSAASETGDDTTAPAPTDGPGVLPGETGLDAFCRRYVECGGTYYGDAQQCIDESLGYWGECKSRRDALDAFGACMSNLDCSEWNPDAYNPGSTPCAQEWSDLGASEACP